MKIKINDLNINYIKEGSKDYSVLILEGWGTSIATYRPLIDSIKQYSTVYCFDMPGFGETDEPMESLNLDDYVNLVIEFIKKQNLKKLSLVCHSNGGRVAIKMMAKDDLPFTIDKVVIIGGAGIIHKKSFKVRTKIRFYKIGKKILSNKLVKFIAPNALENFKKNRGSADYQSSTPVMRETMVKLINTNIEDCLPKVKAPTLFIYGENDTATPASDGEYMSKIIPDSGLVKVPNCGHYVYLENPGYVNLVIKTFFTEKNKL